MPHFQLQEVQMWGRHPLEAGVLGSSVSIKGEISPLQIRHMSGECVIMTSFAKRVSW